MYIVQKRLIELEEDIWTTLVMGFPVSGIALNSIEAANIQIQSHKKLNPYQFRYRILECRVLAPLNCSDCETNSGIDLT